MSRPIASAEGLTASALTALKWSYLGTAVRALAQLVIGIVLARLLGPEPFGLVAVATLVISLGNLVSDAGFGAALIQVDEITDVDIRFSFTVQLILGLVACLSLAWAAVPVSVIFHETQLVPVLRVLSITFIIQALGVTATNLLKRQMSFKQVQLGQVVGYTVGYALIGTPMAFLGYGAWSLITAQLTQTLVSTLWVYMYVRHPIGFRLTASSSGKLYRFGFKVVTTNILNWLIGNADNFVVGHWFGVIPLGLYSKAYNLAVTPVDSVGSVFRSVLFPAYSRVQERTDSLRKGYMLSLRLVLLVTLPMFSGVAAVAGTVILALFGDGWTGASALLVPLSLAMPFLTVVAYSGPVIWATGRVEREVYVQFAISLVFGLLLYVGSHLSVVAVGWGVLVANILRGLLMIHMSLAITRGTWREVWSAARGSFLAATLTTAGLFAVDLLLQILQYGALLRLFADIAVGALLLGVIILVAPRALVGDDALSFLQRVTPERLLRCRLLRRVWSAVPLQASSH